MRGLKKIREDMIRERDELVLEELTPPNFKVEQTWPQNIN